MTKRYLLLILFVVAIHQQIQAQQYGLFNTQTLFDGFENPAQKTFLLDYSRKFSSNFFLPSFGISANNKGNNAYTRTLINEKRSTTADVQLGTNQYNTISENANFYLATLKIFHSYKYQKEIGLSWQVKTEGRLDYTNETVALAFGSFRRLEESGITNFDDAFNNKGQVQSYHQFSLSYRENYDKQLAFGVKLSLLSGISYNRLNITESNFTRTPDPNGIDTNITVKLRGIYRANFLEGDELEKKMLLPTFKNPGAAITVGTTYKARNGTFIMANIKDLGLIRWSKGSAVANFNRNLFIANPDTMTSAQVTNQITDVVLLTSKRQAFYALTNAKADFLISKTFNYYTPSVLVSKNLFYKGGDVVFINKFAYNDFSVSAIPAYNLDGLVLFGAQGMYKTPNFEVYLGSDNIFKTASQVRGTLNDDATIGRGYNGVSFYMGVGFKFGRTVEHPQNSSTMPGINDNDSSFFKRLFGRKR
ncbi:MAG: hypothetical protein EOO92_02690 [Pedobacter sp.]|nr:MAG: hypothetical protein EOO92_02690 [Pedobacter sp.]